jgi:hypothetical protein
VWCVDFHHEGSIYSGEWDLHRLGEAGFALGASQAAKPGGRLAGWSGLHRLSPLTWISPPHVDA